MSTKIIFSVITVVTLFVCSCTHNSTQAPLMSPEDWLNAEKKRAAEYQIIAYATVDTNHAPNIVLIVSEIWKGLQEAQTLGITNGRSFATRWPASADFLPDCGIIYIPRTVEPAQPFLGGGAFFPKNGKVYPGVTIQRLKASVGP